MDPKDTLQVSGGHRDVNDVNLNYQKTTTRLLSARKCQKTTTIGAAMSQNYQTRYASHDYHYWGWVI
jgi:hypothetical protein